VTHITEISKATQWKPGQSGNPNGRPVGTRQAFSAGFYRDLAEVWAAHGKDAMLHTATTQPATFLAIAARLIPSDVRLTVEQQLPGDLTMEDWHASAQVTTKDGRRFVAKLVGRDPGTDVAVLRVSEATGVRAIPMGDSDALHRTCHW
jgi:Family of unknown function (DUF5681)/Trypsin-like peptidase domain